MPIALLACAALALAAAPGASASWQVESDPAEPPPVGTQPAPAPAEGTEPQPPPEEASEPQPATPDRSSRGPRTTFVSNERTRTWWSYVRRRSSVRRRPSRKAPRTAGIARFTYYGLNDVVVVLKRRGRWTKIRHSGLGRRTGWVRNRVLSRPRLTRTRIVINRKRFTLTAYRRGRRVFRTHVGVGAKGSPTPAGRFFMRERLVPRDKDGIYGALAWGTSTYSRYRTDWPGGGQVGIHGTNQPGLIPGRISNGCVRLRNRSIRRLDRIVRRGTPLRIR